jgi:hypothetical protein
MTSLPSIFSEPEWELLKSLNNDTTRRIFNTGLLTTITQQKPLVVIPHSKFTDSEYVASLKRMAVIAEIVSRESSLIVKD